MANVWFLFFYFFSDSSHEHVPVVHLQKLCPFQRPAFVNFLNIAPDLSWVFQGHIDDGQSVFVCFSALTLPHIFVWKKKKVCLVNCVWHGHIEFGARNVFWRRKINLPKDFLVQPFFCIIFGNLCSNCELFDCGNALPIALRVAVSLKVFHPSYINLRFELLIVCCEPKTSLGHQQPNSPEVRWVSQKLQPEVCCHAPDAHFHAQGLMPS